MFTRERPANLAWPYLNPNSPLYQGLVFAGLGPHPGGYDFHDCSPYRNHGTLTNMAVPATATSGWAWDNYLGRWAAVFDGTNDHINLGAVPLGHSLWLPTTLTVVTWHKTNGDYTTSQSLVGHCQTSGATGNYALTFGYTNSKIEFWNNIAGPNITSAASISSDVWRHVAVTRTGTTGAWPLELFLNGVSDKTATATANPSGTYDIGTSIGRLGNYNGYYLNGSLSDMLLWDHALSLSEIAALADPSNVMLSGLILPPRRRLWAISAATGNRRRRLLLCGSPR